MNEPAAPAAPTPDRLGALEKLVDGPRDGALLRYSLGCEYLQHGDAGKACVHLEKAVALNPQHTAAWKMLGKARLAGHQPAQAEEAWQRGMAVAQEHGDVQAAKEMSVFLRRLNKPADPA